MGTKGPLTAGEARTLAAMITGVEPHELAGFILITAINHSCPDCNDQIIGTSTDLKTPSAMRIIGKALMQLGEDMEDNAPDSP